MNRSLGGDLLRAGAIAGALLAFGPAHGASVDAFSAAKGRVFSQTSAEDPEGQFLPFVFRATVEGDLSAITGATVQPPTAFSGPMEIPSNDDGTRLELNVPFQDLNTMGFLFGNGDYRFTFDSDDGDFDLAQVTLNSTTFPTAIPRISNYDAAQTIDPEEDFVLSFNALGDATSYMLVITGSDGEVLSESSTGTSVTIFAGTLAADSLYTARLKFVKEIDRDVDAIPGAVGTAELFNETEFTIGTGEGDGGGEDTTPPFLFATTPVNGATGVGVNSTVSFTFSEQMELSQSIGWSANLNPSLFTYAWSNGRTLVATYTGNFPTNATVTWRLNPSPGAAENFRDLAGNELFSGVFLGSFTTGSGNTDPNDPCTGNPGDDGRGFGNVMKGAYYVQTGNSTPVPDVEMPAIFSGTYRGASNQTITAVSLAGPAGTKNFQNLFGFFLLNEEYNSAAALDAAIPVGTYTINATGAGSASLTLGNVAQIPVPQVGNLTALQSMNVGSEFTLTFSPFTGAGPNDSIFISIVGGTDDGEFHAPDFCKDIELPNTATSVVIPANTFKAGAELSGSITFSRYGSFNTNSIPGTSVSTGASVATNFEFTTGGGTPPTAPRWTTIRRNADGTITFTITAGAGTQLMIEGSTGLGTWTTDGAGIATGGVFEFTVDPDQAAHRLFRAKVM